MNNFSMNEYPASSSSPRSMKHPVMLIWGICSTAWFIFGAAFYYGLCLFYPPSAWLNCLSPLTLLLPGILLGTYYATHELSGYQNIELFGNPTTNRYKIGIIPAALLAISIGVATFAAARTMSLDGGEMIGFVLLRLLLTCLLTLFLAVWIVKPLLLPLLIPVYRKRLLCNHCLRYTRPVWSRYNAGKQYCEHCAQEVEYPEEPSKLVVAFGDVPRIPEGRIFLLENADFEEFDQAKRRMEVAEIYIDSATYSTQLLEKCLTHLFNYPPTHGIGAIRIFYTGSFNQMRSNDRALLEHYFTHIEPVNEQHASAAFLQKNLTLTRCSDNPHHAYWPLHAQCPLCKQTKSLSADAEPVLLRPVMRIGIWLCLMLAIFLKSTVKTEIRVLLNVSPMRPLFMMTAMSVFILFVIGIAALFTSKLPNVMSFIRKRLTWLLRPSAIAVILNCMVWMLAISPANFCQSTVDALYETLKNTNPLIREAAADALGKMGDACAVDILLPALMDHDHDVRFRVATALDQLGWVAVDAKDRAAYSVAKEDWASCVTLGAPAVEALVAVLTDKNRGSTHRNAKDASIFALTDSVVRAKAAHALGEIGGIRAVDALMMALKDTNSQVRRAAANALGKLDATRVEDAIIPARQDTNPTMRRAAADALGERGDARAVDALIPALTDRNREVRSLAASALDRLGWVAPHAEAQAVYLVAKEDWTACIELGAPAVDALISVLNDADFHIQGAASDALVHIGSPAVDALINKLRDKNFKEQGEVRNILTRIGTPAVGQLSALTQNKNIKSSTRQAAADILKQVDAARAVDALIPMLTDQDGWGRKRAAEALEQLGWVAPDVEARAAYLVAQKDWTACIELGAPTVDALIVALNDQDSAIQTAAADALGKIGGARAVDALITALNNKYHEVQAAAANALGEIGGERAVDALIAALESESHNYDALIAEVNALGKIGDARAVDALTSTLWYAHDDDMLEAIVNALDEIGDARAVNVLSKLMQENGKRAKFVKKALITKAHKEKR